jgi:hypothetical protein
LNIKIQQNNISKISNTSVPSNVFQNKTQDNNKTGSLPSKDKNDEF